MKNGLISANKNPIACIKEVPFISFPCHRSSYTTYIGKVKNLFSLELGENSQIDINWVMGISKILKVRDRPRLSHRHTHESGYPVNNKSWSVPYFLPVSGSSCV